MKKSLLLVLLFMITVLSVHAGEDAFIDALRGCSSYASSDNLNVSGIDAKSYKQMLGWQNGKCVYKETIQFGENNIVTTCSFTKPQIQDIISVADSYYRTKRYTNEDLDLTSPDSVKNNPLARVMNKYLQDSSVCTMSGL